MKIRADLSVAHVVDSNKIPFVDSPVKGVERRMLDRDGVEVARATTIVKYAPFATFSKHTHTGGEEFLILDGVFSDEISGDHGRFCYCRHGIGTTHAPWTGENGALLLVKLRQMNDKTEAPFTVVDTPNSKDWKIISNENEKKRERLELFSNETTGERVWMERFEAGFQTDQWIVANGGEEIFVVQGDMKFSNVDGNDDENNRHQCSQGFWIRRPISWAGRRFHVETTEGCQLFIKSGHLAMNLDEINPVSN